MKRKKDCMMHDKDAMIRLKVLPGFRKTLGKILSVRTEL